MGVRRTAAMVVALLVLTSVADGCSDDSTTNVDGLTCSGDRVGRMSIDYATFAGSESPLVAVAVFMSSSGQSLPHEGYELDDGYHDRIDAENAASGISPPATIVDPGAGTAVSHPTKFVVHRSKKGIDVVVTVTDYGEGWVASGATFCSEVQNS